MSANTRNELVALLPRMYRFARSLTRSADRADDLVQSAFERALTRLGQFEAGTRLDRWVFQIIRSVWLNSLRSEKLRRVEPIDDHLDAHVVDGARVAESRLDLADAQRGFDRLPPEQQQALFLVCVEGYTYADAAELLGIPMGTVISRLARARVALAATGLPSARGAGEEQLGQRA